MEINYQKMLETIMDALNYATLVDENCRIIYMSRNYYEGVYGLSRDDIIGRHICDIVPDSRIPAILKNGRASLGEYYYFQNTRENTFANRFPLYVDGELKGLFAEAVIYSFDDVVHMNELVHALKRENRILKKELLNIQKHRHGLESIVGKSEALQNTKKLISKFANSNLSILITGETGTGKELYANAIHYMSNRCNMPYVKINCAAIPGELLESELFGYEKGAFTGASEKGKIGKFEYANGGTVLLDEIGEMPLFLQSKLLRVLQDKCVERVGGVKPIPLDMRVICSTNQNLEEAVRQGRFRSDLYYRINTVEIKVPPLRQRMEDIAPQYEYIIVQVNEENGVFVTGIQQQALRLLEEYQWEGNVRELEHVLQRACVAAGAGELTIRDFDFLLERIFRHSAAEQEPGAVENLAEKTAKTEREEIIKALVQTNGNKSKTAKILGIDRTVLYSKIRKYNLKI